MLRPPTVPSLRPPEGHLWMMSYGSNMASEVLTGRRRVAPRASVPAVVPSHALSFDMLGLPYGEPAFAVLKRRRRRPGASSGGGDGEPPQAWWPATAADGAGWAAAAGPPPAAHGVLHLVTCEDWRRVLASEGVLVGGDGGGGGDGGASLEPASLVDEEEDGEGEENGGSSSSGGGGGGFGYRVARVRCLAYAPCARDLAAAAPQASSDLDDDADDDPYAALPPVDALTLLASRRPQHAASSRRARPSRRYLTLLQRGAREHGLLPDYRRWLESRACYEGAAGGVGGPAAAAGLLAAGAAVAAIAAAPALPLVAAAAGVLGSSGNGRAESFAGYANLAQRALWWAHDVALAPVLGEGGATTVVVGGGGSGGERGGGGGVRKT